MNQAWVIEHERRIDLEKEVASLYCLATHLTGQVKRQVGQIRELHNKN